MCSKNFNLRILRLVVYTLYRSLSGYASQEDAGSIAWFNSLEVEMNASKWIWRTIYGPQSYNIYAL